MPPPKLTKKHRTFDCDLIDMEQHRQNAHSNNDHRPSPSLSSTTPTNNDGHQTPTTQIAASKSPANLIGCQNHHHTDDATFADCTTLPERRNDDAVDVTLADGQQRLSKLVLSSSLHRLADSKYHTNNPNCQPNANSAQRQPPTMGENAAVQRGDSTASNGAQLNGEQQPAPISSTGRNDPHHHIETITTNCDINDPSRRQIANCYKQQTSTTNANNNCQHNGTKPNTLKTANAKPTTQNVKREANLDTVHVVVGNESCDLDSAVSCLLMFHIISKMSDEINGKDKTRTLYIPLLNTTRDMLDSKCEVLWFLQKTLNIDKSFLTCKDDIDWNEIKKNGVEVLVTLVDHNYNEEFNDIGKIVEIIDHHEVQNSQWLMENQSLIRLTLDTQVGSCTTLVAERLFYIYAEHHVSDEILLLIYGTVLLDTICLSEKAKRFTRRDVYLLKKLDSLLGSRKPVRDELYKQLVEVKNSTRELNFEKLMKRDLKIYKDKHGLRVGIASLFGMAAREALGLAANIDLDLFFRQNQYEAFIIMGLVADLDHSDSISRDLVLISANRRLFEQLCQAFEQDTSKLDLQPIGSDASPDPEDNIINNKRIVDSSSDLSKSTPAADGLTSECSQQPFYKARIWLQRNVTSSRKVVAPLVLKVLHDGAQ